LSAFVPLAYHPTLQLSVPMPKFMNMCLVLGTVVLDIASSVQGACDSQAHARCTAAPSSDIELPPGVHLFQSSVGRSVMRSAKAMGLHMYDLEESEHVSPTKPLPSPSSDDYALYLGICIDMLVCLIIVEGWRRFRRMRTKRSVAPTKTPNKSPDIDASADDLEAKTLVLHAAVCSGDSEKCEALLKSAQVGSGGMKRLLLDSDKWGRTVLHLAVLRGSESMCALLLKYGAKVDAMDAWDHAPLHCAAYSGSVECCRLLLQHGADVNVVDAGERTPLHVSADLSHEAVCRLLLEHGGTLSKENTAEVPAMLSALLVEQIFQKPAASSPPLPVASESASRDCMTESYDEWPSNYQEDDMCYDSEEQE